MELWALNWSQLAVFSASLSTESPRVTPSHQPLSDHLPLAPVYKAVLAGPCHVSCYRLPGYGLDGDESKDSSP